MKPLTRKPTNREILIGQMIKKNGGTYGTRLAIEASHFDIPVSVVCAVCEIESDFSNVFGHDVKANGKPSGIPAKWMGTNVTEAKYRWYKMGRAIRGTQGVGPFQLTFKGYQDEADRDGGCCHTDVNIATAVAILARLYHEYRSWEKVYAFWNAGSNNAEGVKYAAKVLRAQQNWHHRFAAVESYGYPT